MDAKRFTGTAGSVCIVVGDEELELSAAVL
jgi:hypothetical protein